MSVSNMASDSLCGTRVSVLHMQLSELLSQAGLDICVPFNLGRYNEVAPDKARIQTRSFSEGDSTLGFLFGNSKSMWAKFIEACKENGSLIDSSNPLDTYVKESVSTAVASIDESEEAKCVIYWSNDKYDNLMGGTGYVSIQKLAAGLGICYLESSSHLCLHPEYGSWFSLRGFCLFDGMVFPTCTYQMLANPLTSEQEQRVKLALQRALSPADASEAADASGATYSGVRDQWKKWVEVRLALHPSSEPHPWQYDKKQLCYHYTSCRDILRKCVASSRQR